MNQLTQSIRIWPFLLSFMILFCLVLPSQNIQANDNTENTSFQDASSAYSRGEYELAIQGFEALAREGLSAPLLYNLGNSYAQNGQSGKAVLNYERALRLAPNDSDILGNLELIRKDKGLFQEEQSFGQRFIQFFGMNQWLTIASLAFVFFAVILLLPPAARLKKSSRYGIAATCLFIFITAGASAFGQYQHWHDGVVVVSDARLRISPFESAASVGTIQEGRLLRPGKIHNEYVLVVDESGQSGWLATNAFEAIANL